MQTEQDDGNTQALEFQKSISEGNFSYNYFHSYFYFLHFSIFFTLVSGDITKKLRIAGKKLNKSIFCLLPI